MVFREIRFQEGSIVTDALLYREKSHLLLPEPFTENVFMNVARGSESRLFIGSRSAVNMNRMVSFFRSMYDAATGDASMESDSTGYSVSFYIKKPFLKEKEVYYPGLVRNVFDFSTMESRAVIRYSVSIRSGLSGFTGKENFGVHVSISFDSDSARKLFLPLIQKEIRKMKSETGMRIRKSRSSKIADSSLHLPFNLINLIRIPSESDIA